MKAFALLPVFALTLITGCSFDAGQDGLNDAPTGRVFGGPSDNLLFAPYQGEWHFEGEGSDLAALFRAMVPERRYKARSRPTNQRVDTQLVDGPSKPRRGAAEWPNIAALGF